ncbi:hypothetical protein BLL40_10080 [Domibacillus mangrovi]|uniref:SpoVT-AbrB domain-containing protein n=2 Tax=Domibacillus mangrovi TaxID=1714354 RepID=A0A1Q5P1Y7_9BACI|nr:hypothetical protein BLL40_10080 [Domibacillus mangrovi]
MKEIMIRRVVDKEGRVTIPKSMRTQLGIQELDEVAMVYEQESIVMRKYDSPFDGKEEKTCFITGSISNDHWHFSGDIVLSKEGAIWLLDEIQSYWIKVGI